MNTTFHARDARTAPRLIPAVNFVKRHTVARFTGHDMIKYTGCTNPAGVISELAHDKNGFRFDRVSVRAGNGARVSYWKCVFVPKWARN